MMKDYGITRGVPIDKGTNYQELPIFNVFSRLATVYQSRMRGIESCATTGCHFTKLFEWVDSISN